MAPLTQSRITLIAALVILHIPVVCWLGLTSPYMHDEVHFARTIRLFADEPTLQTLRTYPEMSTPLPFVTYAAWGKLFGFEPATQRSLSLLIALVTYMVIYQLIVATLKAANERNWTTHDQTSPNPSSPRRVCDLEEKGVTPLPLREGRGRVEPSNPSHACRRALWLTLFIAVNPYMLALSILVYTDMLTILFSLAAMLAWHHRKPMPLFLALAAAVLSRQYAVCYTVAVGAIVLIERFRKPRADTDRLLLAVAASMLPFVALAAYWGGLTPALPRFETFTDQAMRWHPASFVLYVGLLSIYLLPLLLLRLNRFFSDWRAWLIAAAAGLCYPLAPVRTSPAAESYGAAVVGFFDRAIQMLGPIPGRDAVFCAAFMLGIPVAYALVTDAARRWRTRSVDTLLLADFVVLAFLLIMPLGALHWEKYFVMILPVACLAVLGPPKHEI